MTNYEVHRPVSEDVVHDLKLYSASIRVVYGGISYSSLLGIRHGYQS